MTIPPPAVRPDPMSAIHRCLAGLGMGMALLSAGCKPSGRESLLRGDAALQAGRSAEAVAWLERAAQLLPSEAEAWNRLGLAYHQAGRLDEAAKAYGRALQFNRDLFDVHFNLGELLLEQGRHHDADASFRTYLNASQDNARNAAAWRGLGLALQAQRQHPAAETALGNATRLDPSDALAWNALGVSRVQLRKPRDAQAALLKATQIDPQLAAARLNLAVVLHQHLSSPRDALAQYQAFLQLQPDGPEADSARVAVRDLSIRLGLATRTNAPVPPVVSTPRRAATNPPVALPSTDPAPTASSPVPSSTPTSPPVAVSRPSNVVAASALPPAVPKPTPGPKIPPPPAIGASATATTPAPPATPPTPFVGGVSSDAGPSSARPSTVPRIANPPPTPVATVAENASATAVTPPPPASQPKPEPVTLEVVRVQDEPPPRPAIDPPAPPAKVVAALPATPAATPAAPAPDLDDPPLPDSTGEPDPTDAAEGNDTGRERRSVWRRMNPVTWGNPVRWFRREPQPEDGSASKAREVDPGKGDPATDSASAKAVPASKPVAQAKPRAVLPPKPRTPAPLVTPLDVTPEPLATFPRYQRSVLAAPSVGNTGAAQAEFLRGTAAHGRNDTAAAVAAYRKAIDLDPAHFASHYNLSLLSLQQGNLPDALRSAESAVAIDPRSHVARYNLAVALQRARHPIDAAEELERITREQPAEANAHLALASLCDLDLRDVARARTHYRRVLEVQPAHPKADFIRQWLERHAGP